MSHTNTITGQVSSERGSVAFHGTQFEHLRMDIAEQPQQTPAPIEITFPDGYVHKVYEGNRLEAIGGETSVMNFGSNAVKLAKKH